MIENLEKLREQADLEALDIFEAHPDFPKSVPFGYYHENRDRIFAELIVKETIQIIQATSAESIDLDRTLIENVSWIVNDIKNQFGVK